MTYTVHAVTGAMSFDNYLEAKAFIDANPQYIAVNENTLPDIPELKPIARKPLEFSEDIIRERNNLEAGYLGDTCE